MSATYAITSRFQLNKWDAALQQAVEGWEIRALWASTGTTLTVFVPLTAYNPTNVDAAIRQAGALDDQIGALGTAATKPPPPSGA